MTSPREHRFFAVNDLVAECMDCRIRKDIPNPHSHETLEAKLAYLKIGFVGSQWSEIKPCHTRLLTFFNPTKYTLRAEQLFGPLDIKPGEMFYLGDADGNRKLVKKMIPQVEEVSSLDRGIHGIDDIIPLDALELVHFTNYVGDYPYADLGFISHRP